MDSQFCSRILSTSTRKIFYKFIRFVLLVILMVTVIINVLFIIDAHGRLAAQNSQRQSSGSNRLNSLGSNRAVKMEILSSRERCMAVIDGTVIMDDNDPERNRGIHVLVLNQVTGSVMARRHFDTYSPGEDEAMSLFLSMISDGRFLIFAIKDEGSFQLKKPARDLLTRLGSKEAHNIGWRSMWAMVTQKQSPSGAPIEAFGEVHEKSPDPATWAAPAVLKFDIQLQENDDSACQWAHNDQESKMGAESGDFSIDHENLVAEFLKSGSGTSLDSEGRALGAETGALFLPDDIETQERRQSFCSRIEGYGAVCSCTNPLPLRFGVSYDARAQISRVPIAVIASNRPHYLYRMLRTLLSTQGCNPSMITVFIDGYYEEPLEVARLFGLRGIQHTPIGTKNARISQHYKASLTALFSIYPEAEYAIVLEEDLDVSPDFFQYFADTMPLLERDDSIFCVSAWNDLAYEYTASNDSLLYRVEPMPGLGWMLTRRLFKSELEPKWPPPDKQWDWDIWMRLPEIRKDRECIVPDVPRTFHFGASGMNMNSYFQETYFKKHAFNTNPQARVKNIDSVLHDNYEHLVTKLIQRSKIIDLTSSGKRSSASSAPMGAPITCELSVLRQKIRHSDARNRGSTPQTYVLYIHMEHSRDFESWLSLARCLKVWDLDARGYHKAVWRLQLDGAQLLVVGTPHSPFSVFKPSHVQPVVFSRNVTTKRP